MNALARLLDERSVLVCVGTGGVGKTTTAAALAMAAARRGRRVCVLTIDPARRLSDAMGLDESVLGNEPRRVELPRARDDGAGHGELWAVMLDTATTFDALIATYAPTPQQQQTILTNGFYRNIADSMSGAHEYMAMEKLYELHADERFDLVVVDTPPTTNAIDFLEAPDRIRRFLDHRLYSVLVTPTGGLARVANAAARTFLRSVARVVGASVVDDAIEFFAAFDGMEEGFRARAAAVERLLRAEGTAFVAVATPRPDVVRDVLAFSGLLRGTGIDTDAVVVNRVHPRFTAAMPAGLEDPSLAPFTTVLAQSIAITEAEEATLAPLHAVLDVTVVRVPLLDADVHDLAGLDALGPILLAEV
ncbi:MAG: ArsA family ATPase [Acidimicrobiia bacterium]|nr:ArsA family ATPase [Acidimicrobiia bacterium]